MERPHYGITKRRAAALMAVLAIILAGYSVRLFDIQIMNGDRYGAIASAGDAVKVPIAASRGEILDRYLKPLAVNRTSFSIIFDYAYFPRGSSDEVQKQQNDIILSLTELLTRQQATWSDTLPITKTTPYAFEEGRDSSIAYLKSDNMLRMADYATAEQCMAELVEKFALQAYTPEQQRTIAGVRYEMKYRNFSLTNAFVFSSDISEQTYTIILENSNKYPGVNVQTTPVREYVGGTVGCHLLGTVGYIYAEEYANLKSQGYSLNDIVGKSGIESALESALRGKNGVSTITRDANGTVVDKQITQAPVSGNNVILTLDYDLQKAAQAALGEKIAYLRSQNDKGHDVLSGAAVVLDVKNGGVLTCASWPDYDLSLYNTNYSQLIKDTGKPLFNRALNGAFAIGSTMKPCVATAALNEGTINATDTVYCGGEYLFFADSGYTPGCMGVHYNVSVVRALSESCNVFFYDVGRRLGITKMNEYSKLFGLGQKTGIEIGETAGVLAGPAHRKKNGEPWYDGDTCQAAIGQSDNLITPIQLAAYASTLANDGVRYKTHLVKATMSADGTQTIVQPEVAAKLDLSQLAIDKVREGMVDVVKSGTARTDFAGVSYTVAAKTGTAEAGNGGSDHGVFIAYAPVENPEVAIAVVLENGTSHPAAQVARQILDAYFSGKNAGAAPTPEGQLLP